MLYNSELIEAKIVGRRGHKSKPLWEMSIFFRKTIKETVNMPRRSPAHMPSAECGVGKCDTDVTRPGASPCSVLWEKIEI